MRVLSALLLFLLALALPVGAQETAVGDTSLAVAPVARGEGLMSALDSLLADPLFDTSQLGLCVYDLTDSTPVVRRGEHQRMRPASTQKLLTAITALTRLGADYTFLTRLYIEGEPDSTGTLGGNIYVEGGMDPQLSERDLHVMADSLRARGVRKLTGSLVMDVSFRRDEPYGWGWCWDDDYGPLTALAYEGHDTFAPHFLRALRQGGIQTSGVEVRKGRVARRGCRLVAVLRRPLLNVLKPMLQESDNICAESLFAALAAYAGGRDLRRDATRHDAAHHIDALADSLGLDTRLYTVADGSGLSPYNYLSPALLVRFLTFAWQRDDLRKTLLATLPVMGRSGTLKSRLRHTEAEGKVWAKTGSVTAVSSLAGYVETRSGHVLVFAVINQGLTRAVRGREWQDRLVSLLVEI